MTGRALLYLVICVLSPHRHVLLLKWRVQVMLLGQEHPYLTSLSFGYPFEKEQ